MQINKISSRPPNKKHIEEFILGAEQKNKNYEHQRESYPWEDSAIRKDVQKVFTVKLPEEYILKIKFISEKTNKSQQKIVREVVCSEVNKLISQLIR